VYLGRQARAAQEAEERRLEVPRSAMRRALFEALEPVALANCELKRFGETNDGGYLLCANLLKGVRAGYSYGISGYDKWGCDVSTALKVPVHQYDCFNTTQPLCPTGQTSFHAECIAETTRTVEGRPFDTLENQLARNGHAAARIALKMDVEGAEWASLLEASEETLNRIDQLAIEFHWVADADDRYVHDEKHLAVITRLKQFFWIAHVHHNNAGCVDRLKPFPSWAYEVLFVSKRLGVVDPARKATIPHPLDAPNNPNFPDCQSSR
jgi:hypothetical protein